MGQYSQRGVLWVWGCAPLFFGVGLAMVAACILMSFYYNIFAAYSLVYFSRCFNWILPWTYCSDIVWENSTCAPPTWYSSRSVTPPSKDYFYDIVLNTPYRHPPEEWTLGTLKWWLFLSLLFSWFVIYLATLRSARSIGKIAIFIVIFSYFAILMLLVVAFQLRGSERLRSLMINGTENKSVFSLEMWSVATMQVLLELGICHGIPVAYASFCRYRNFVHIDSIILCLVNYINSIIFYYLFFSYIGSFACDIDNLPWDIADNSIAIIYIIYSQAFSSISGSNLWCAVFFFMMFCIILGTQIAITEAIMTAIYDNVVKLSRFRWLINLLVCGFFFLFGIIFCFSHSFYGATLVHSIQIFFVILSLTCLFAIGIIFVYGLSRYFENMHLMLNYNLNLLLKIFLYLVVLLLVLVLLITWFSVHSTTFTGSVVYEKSHFTAAWVMCALIIFCPIVICALLWILRCLFTRKNICGSSNAWTRGDEERKQANGQFTTNYSHSYTWPWNKY
jgi:SNF family Na+-dependent transporter